VEEEYETEEEDDGPPPPTVVSFGVGLTDMTMDQFDDDKQASFKEDLAKKLGVPVDKVGLPTPPPPLFK